MAVTDWESVNTNGKNIGVFIYVKEVDNFLTFIRGEHLLLGTLPLVVLLLFLLLIFYLEQTFYYYYYYYYYSSRPLHVKSSLMKSRR